MASMAAKGMLWSLFVDNTPDEATSLHQLLSSDNERRCKTNDVVVSLFYQQSMFLQFQTYIPCRPVF